MYCAPPYGDATGYGTWSSGFDTDAFWGWAVDLNKRCRVFVSEYEIPASVPHAVLWRKEVTSSLTADTGSKSATEKFVRLRYGG